MKTSGHNFELSKSTREHQCEVRHADPVDGRPVEGWLVRCSCGFSAGNFAEYERAVDEGHAHLDSVILPSRAVENAMAQFHLRQAEIAIEKRDPVELKAVVDAAKAHREGK